MIFINGNDNDSETTLTNLASFHQPFIFSLKILITVTPLPKTRHQGFQDQTIVKTIEYDKHDINIDKFSADIERIEPHSHNSSKISTLKALQDKHKQTN